MSRPEISPENIDALMKFQGERRPNRYTMAMLQQLSAVVYNPEVHCAPAAKEEAATAIGRGTSLALPINHISKLDQVVVGGGVHKTKELGGLTGSVTITSKPAWFDNPVMRWILENQLGARTVFRPDVDEDLERYPSLEDKSVASYASQKLIDVLVNDLRYGSISLHPEGTRNTGDPTKMLPLKRGIGWIARLAYEEGMDVAIMPVLVFYEDLHKPRPHPHIYIQNLMYGPFTNARQTVSDLTDQMHDGLAELVKIAQ